MISIKEYFNNKSVYYELKIIENENVTFKRTIYYKTIIKEFNKSTYLMLYDTNLNPISEVFRFINFDNANQSINTKIKSLEALKFLYSFQSIINKELENFNKGDINSLKVFLKGLSPKGQIMKFDLISTRNNETINGYFSVYRQFLNSLEKTNEALFKKSNRKADISILDTDISITVEKFDTNEMIPNKLIEIPYYISVEDFNLIIKEIRKNYGLREEIIVRLMFQCGLRIGEVLGLTADDILIEKLGSDDLYVPVIYIRNRLSDNKFQHAKTCMKIINKKQYHSKEYKIEGYGFQKINVPQDLYDLINHYIEIYHINAREKKHENYYKYTIADRVRKNEKYEDDNYYVFINSLGKPLSQILWNNILRTIFASVGIEVDKEIRVHNLNHRFRHGFAMFNVKYLGCKELELMDRMRHNSLLSVCSYFKPTLSDSIKVKTDFTNSLYKIIPDLKQKE